MFRSLTTCAVFLFVGLTGCAELTEIVVVSDTDFSVPSGLDEFQLEVDSQLGMIAPRRRSLVAVPPPILTTLTPLGSDDQNISVRLVGRRGGAEVICKLVQTNFSPGTSRRLDINLAQTDAGCTCTPDSECEIPRVAGSDLPLFVESDVTAQP